MNKPLLKEPIRTVQPIDVGGIFPDKSNLGFMDIDGVIGDNTFFGVERFFMCDWKRHGFIFIETKYHSAPLSQGQRQGIANFVDLMYDGFLHREEPQNIIAYFVVSHAVDNPTQSIFVADCPVVTWYLPKKYSYYDEKTKKTTAGGWGPWMENNGTPFKWYVWRTIQTINRVNGWIIHPKFYVNEKYVNEFIQTFGME